MSKPYVFLWLPMIPGGIAGEQSQAQDSYLVLNGNTPIANTGAPGIPAVFSYAGALPSNLNTTKNSIRSISISSPDDNSGVTFVINGIGAPVDVDKNPTNVIGPITENLVGPNGDTVVSANVYTQINSILVTNDDATNVQVNPGPFGITPYVSIDTDRTFSQIQAQLQFYNRQHITVNVYACLNKPESPNTMGQLVAFGTEAETHAVYLPLFPVIEDAEADILQPIVGPVATIWAKVTSDFDGPMPALPEDAFIFTVLQQGIR